MRGNGEDCRHGNKARSHNPSPCRASTASVTSPHLTMRHNKQLILRQYLSNTRTATSRDRISGCLPQQKPILTLASIPGLRFQKDLPMRSNTRLLNIHPKRTTLNSSLTRHVLHRPRRNLFRPTIPLHNGLARKRLHIRLDHCTAVLVFIAALM